MIDFGLIITYLLISIAALACIISPIIQMKNDADKLKKMMIPAIMALLLVGLAMMASSSEVLPEYTDSNGNLISNTLSKLVGGSLITFYILSIITIGAVLYSEFLHKLFKNGKK